MKANGIQPISYLIIAFFTILCQLFSNYPEANVSDNIRLPSGSRWQFQAEIQLTSECSKIPFLGTWTNEQLIRLEGEFSLSSVPPDLSRIAFLSNEIGIWGDPTLTLDQKIKIALASEPSLTDAELVAKTDELRALLYNYISGSAKGTLLWKEGEHIYPILYARSPDDRCVCDPIGWHSFPIDASIGGTYGPDGMDISIEPNLSSGQEWKQTIRRRCVIYETDENGSQTSRVEYSDYDFIGHGNYLNNLDYIQGEQTITHTDELSIFFPVKISSTARIILTPECRFATDEAERKITIETITSIPNYTPDNSLSVDELNQLGQSAPEEGNRLGYTSGDPHRPAIDWTFRASGSNFGDRYCFYVDSGILILELPVKVYIADKYPPGSCPYNALLEHEKKHVAIFQEIMVKYSKIMQEAILNARGIPTRAQPMSFQSMEEGAAYVDGIIAEVLLPIYLDYRKELNISQKIIDTTEEKDRVRRMCAEEDWR
jgi:hypothetical protein